MARYLTVQLTLAEAKALLAAVAQMTDGNANDYGAWKDQTSGSLHRMEDAAARRARPFARHDGARPPHPHPQPTRGLTNDDD